MKTQNCEITNIKECDILYQVTYVRHCDNCGYVDTKERKFCSVMKNGYTVDIDNWRCPHCNSLCETTITTEENLQ